MPSQIHLLHGTSTTLEQLHEILHFHAKLSLSPTASRRTPITRSTRFKHDTDTQLCVFTKIQTTDINTVMPQLANFTGSNDSEQDGYGCVHPPNAEFTNRSEILPNMTVHKLNH